MALPIPRLSRFCVCLDVHTGVRFFSIGLSILWILYALQALLAKEGSQGNSIWATIWCICNVAAYVMVIVALRMNKNKMFIIPALAISVFDVVVAIIQVLILFLTLHWISAVFLLIIAGITAYYALGLKTVFDDLSSGPGPAEPV